MAPGWLRVKQVARSGHVYCTTEIVLQVWMALDLWATLAPARVLIVQLSTKHKQPKTWRVEVTWRVQVWHRLLLGEG